MIGALNFGVREALVRILKDDRGIALTEFAATVPLVLFLGLAGAEVANLATAQMKVSQIALAVSDNASRLGQTDNSGVTPTISEADLDAVIDGALRAGEAIDLEENGRIIVSSLEYDDFSNAQYIHWQRCRGDLAVQSPYGNDTTQNGLNGPPLEGMGKRTKVNASPGQAIMFVEVYYDYDPMLNVLFGETMRFSQEAGLMVRDDRNFGPGLTGGGSQSTC